VLAGAVLHKARIDQRTGLDGADLAGADLRGAILGSADPIRSAAHWELALLDPAVRSAVPALPPRRGITLGLLIADEQYFYKEIERGARRAAGEAGAQLLVRVVDTAAANGVEHEAALLYELTGAGMDALLVVPQDELRSVPALRQAWAAGVALVSYDQALHAGDAARYVSHHYASSHWVLGYETGRYLARWLARGDRVRHWGRVGIFRSCNSAGCYERAQGFRRALDDSGVLWREVAYRSRAPGEDSFAIASALLAHHDIQVLWAANEDGTQGAVAAVRALGLVGRVRVVGTDISPILEKMLGDRDGVLLAVTAQQPEEMAYRAASTALAALRGEDVRHRKNGVVGVRRYVRKGG
jgi:ABC-type sugar transport system substrate-binding protein